MAKAAGNSYSPCTYRHRASRRLYSRLVTKTRVSSGGRAGLTRPATEAPGGVLVQYVEEADRAQRRQDGGFLHFAQWRVSSMQ